VARRRVVSDAEITRAARKVFLEHGTRAPVAWVARELGVSTATVFVRMGSKMGLINAALWPPDPPVLERMLRGPDGGTPALEQLRDIVADLAHYVDAEIPATFTLYAAGLRARPGEDFSDVSPARLRRALTSWLRHAARGGQLVCAPRVVAELILSTLEARAMHAFLGKRAVSAREQRAFIRALLKSVLGKKGD
jgi:AcrR family transcriptional regulator